jgi:hypothetical protein
MMARFRPSTRAPALLRNPDWTIFPVKGGDNSFDSGNPARDEKPLRRDSDDAYKFSENLNRSSFKLDRHLI